MNARLKPVEAVALTRPRFRRYDLVRTNLRDAWIIQNMDVLLAYFRATGDAIRAAGEWTPPDDPQVEFTVFCDLQFEGEHARYEELKNEKDYEYAGASNGSRDWSNV